ncbi:hypothetical protein [Streptomyces sp. JHA26]|uniref:hypothetical protein n=1 Tax=Streptomyces sp. JHA26 TaxID=1917143 RepID=UPI000989C675|nr:hypothetical protein [Streptomyces sp. JHA26]
MTPATVRRAAALGLGALWCWAALRLVMVPGAGAVEGAVVAGGWGLSVLPVHCVPRSRAAGGVGARWCRRALRALPGPRPSRGPGGACEAGRRALTSDNTDGSDTAGRSA